MRRSSRKENVNYGGIPKELMIVPPRALEFAQQELAQNEASLRFEDQIRPQVTQVQQGRLMRKMAKADAQREVQKQEMQVRMAQDTVYADPDIHGVSQASDASNASVNSVGKNPDPGLLIPSLEELGLVE